MIGTKAATLVLASSSPRRQELIRSLQLPVVIKVSDADETVPDSWQPSAIVEELSLRKARTVAETLEPGADGAGRSIVIGSDTIVVLDGNVLGKPTDRDDAVRMLSLLQGRSHLVYSGVACLSDARSERRMETGEPMEAGDHGAAMRLGDIGQYRVLSQPPSGLSEAIVGHMVSKVTFRPMSDEEIEAYVKTGEPLDKAGSYGVQGLGALFIEKMEGDFYSVMGLPLNLLYQMLLKFGISPFSKSEN